MASRKLSTAGTSSILQNSNVQVGNQNPTSVMTGKQTLGITQGNNNNNKNIIRRTRNALGDIGNRITNKGTNLKVGTGTGAKVSGGLKTTTTTTAGTKVSGGLTTTAAAGTTTTTTTTTKKSFKKSSVNFVIPALPTSSTTLASGRNVLNRNNSTAPSSSTNGPSTSSFSAFSTFRGLKSNNARSKLLGLKTQPLQCKIKTTITASSSTLTCVNVPIVPVALKETEIIRRISSKDEIVSSTGEWNVVEVTTTTTTTNEKEVNELVTEIEKVIATVNVGGRTTTSSSSNLNESTSEQEIDELSKAFSLQRFEIRDIDAEDESVNSSRDYIKDIAEYLFKLEKKYPIKVSYLNGRVINGRMRSVLMDWLVEVHSQFNYCAETLFMTAKILDRFLHMDTTVTRTQLQLVGVTALYLSAKFEEVVTPNINDFSSVSDNAFNNNDLKKMEEKILKSIQFDLSPPQPVFFLRRCSKASQAPQHLHQLAKYIMELSLIDYEVVHLLPSQIAAGAYSVASMILENKPPAIMWTATMEYYGRYSLIELKPVLKLLIHTLARPYEEPSKLQAVTNKFARGRAYRISKIPEVQAYGVWKPRILAELENIN